MPKSVPYESAQSGASARDEITKVLRRFGCESIGFMDNFSEHEVLLAFDIVGLGRQNEPTRAGNTNHFINGGARIGHVDQDGLAGHEIETRISER
jgi:hypothetical protein